MHSKSRRAGDAVAVLCLVLLMCVPFLAAGCGPQTPQQVAEDFYDSIENHNWNAYLNCILPDNVRDMTEKDVSAQKEQFLTTELTFDDLKMKTKYKNKDKTKADVELTAGVIKIKDPVTGKVQTTTVKQIKKEGGTALLETEEYKGRWYVDKTLASPDIPLQGP